MQTPARTSSSNPARQPTPKSSRNLGPRSPIRPAALTAQNSARWSSRTLRSWTASTPSCTRASPRSSSANSRSGVAAESATPDLELAEDDLGDARVHDGVEAVQLRKVREDHRAEFCAVNAAGRIGDRGPKFLDDFGVGSLAGFDELVREGVRVKHCKAHFA